jgi:alanine dehydrogenase
VIAAPVGTPYEQLTVGVPKELSPTENRVGITPANVAMFQKVGINVNIEKGAGLKSSFTDAAFEEQVSAILLYHSIANTSPAKPRVLKS